MDMRLTGLGTTAMVEAGSGLVDVIFEMNVVFEDEKGIALVTEDFDVEPGRALVTEAIEVEPGRMLVTAAIEVEPGRALVAMAVAFEVNPTSTLVCITTGPTQTGAVVFKML